MYKETITLTRPVKCISSTTGIENILELDLEEIPQVEEDVFVAEPAVFNEFFDEQVMDPGRQYDLLEEQNELLAQIKNLLGDIQKSVAYHLAEEKNALEQIFEKIPAIAFQIAEKVVHKKVESDNTIIIENIRMALTSVGHDQKLKVSMNPNDIHIVKSSLSEFGIDESTFTKYWELEPNKDISPGGCLIKTTGEEIDARVTSQLKALEETILKSVK